MITIISSFLVITIILSFLAPQEVVVSGGFHYGFSSTVEERRVQEAASSLSRATRTSYIYNLDADAGGNMGWRLGAPLPVDLFGGAVVQKAAAGTFMIIGGGMGYEVVEYKIMYTLYT